MTLRNPIPFGERAERRARGEGGEGDGLPRAPRDREPQPTRETIPAPPKVVAKEPTYHCENCGKDVGEHFTGQDCPHCGAFRTIVFGKAARAAPNARGGKPMLLHEVPDDDFERLATGTREWDRVLGGGIVTGGVFLLGGDPGIGKSTLAMQTLIDMATCKVTVIDGKESKETDKLKVLYVSGEEPEAQVKGRAERLGGIANPKSAASAKDEKRLYLLYECDVVEIAKHITELEPDVVCIDSIQKMVKPGIDGAAGSVSQIRECTNFLVDIFKRDAIGALIIAHVTKDGAVAGPMTLEHLVDAVLEFHKEGMGDLRSVRSKKNRFASTNEMALFRMTETGLQSVENPSELLLENHEDGRVGVCVGLATFRDSPRPFALEVQVMLGPLPELDLEDEGKRRGKQMFKRVVNGMQTQRATQIIAVLERRFGIDFQRDVYINVPGDHDEVRDPSFDLPLALALISEAQNMALPKSMVAYGEIGLSGEVRASTFGESRVRHAALMRFKKIFGPIAPAWEAASIIAALTDDDDGKSGPKERYFGVTSLEEVFDLIEGFTIAPVATKQSTIKGATKEDS